MPRRSTKARGRFRVRAIIGKEKRFLGMFFLGPTWGCVESLQPVSFRWPEISETWLSRVRVKEVARYQRFKSSSTHSGISRAKQDYWGWRQGQNMYVPMYVNFCACIIYACICKIGNRVGSTTVSPLLHHWAMLDLDALMWRLGAMKLPRAASSKWYI